MSEGTDRRTDTQTSNYMDEWMIAWMNAWTGCIVGNLALPALCCLWRCMKVCSRLAQDWCGQRCTSKLHGALVTCMPACHSCGKPTHFAHLYAFVHMPWHLRSASYATMLLAFQPALLHVPSSSWAGKRFFLFLNYYYYNSCARPSVVAHRWNVLIGLSPRGWGSILWSSQPLCSASRSFRPS